MKNPAKPRRILLLVISAVWIFLEVLNGVSNYNDRSSWFQGLGAMIVSLFFIPPLMGLMYGAFEATGGYAKKHVGGAVIRMLAILIARGVIGTVIYALTLHTEWDLWNKFLDYYPQTSLFTLGLGMLGFAAAFAVGFAVDSVAKAPKGTKLDRVSLILIALMFLVMSLDAIFDAHPRAINPDAIDFSYICMALLPTLMLTWRRVFGGASVQSSVFTALGLSVATVLVYLFGSIIQGEPSADVGAVFAILPFALGGCLLALAAREAIVCYYKRKNPEVFDNTETEQEETK